MTDLFYSSGNQLTWNPAQRPSRSQSHLVATFIAHAVTFMWKPVKLCCWRKLELYTPKCNNVFIQERNEK